MKQDEFDDLVSKRLSNCKRLLTSKLEDYATNKDRLHNFKDGAFLSGQTPEQYALSLVTKHIIAIRDKVISGEEMSARFINEKFGDVINYILLLEALKAEEKK